ncbi:DsbA family protein [Oceanicoccus sagamiensis]|uniref:2-hydroxychromene-2-carboxylate isomerase n=1 Tax=Oceanicoccus sagamiensis TaxID=716816 RepID=A0A1X9N3F1_9GAMM|nr:DsbA family protein [Oceanicoccus sagamiensis]ARN72728.1 2-hydroxychromene-2-carboxylate isomerase [Oceanicoccus sagamiensis]
MLEPENNPNPSYYIDPPRLMRFMLAKRFGRLTDSRQIAKRRMVAEKKRQQEGRAHVVEYFHQVDDPYSHLMAQVLAQFAARYNIDIVPHLIRATGGRHQPELDKLAIWGRRDCGLIAPHYGLSFPEAAGVVPEPALQQAANAALTHLGSKDFIAQLADISTRLWSGDAIDSTNTHQAEVDATLDAGSARLNELGHYSGAMLYYEGEWYWGVDRLFYLEQRLRELGLAKTAERSFLVARPEIEVSDIDASGLDLHFFPSLNSPYTSIIYDRTIELSKACKINFHHKPVLPMIMRGVAATPAKGFYIYLDTKREGDYAGVPFGNSVTPVGEPVRQCYSLLPWAKSLGKDTALLSTFLRYAFAEGRGLHRKKNIRRAVAAVGLDWQEAKKHLGGDEWKPWVEQYQDEMVQGMGLWGVPSYRLCGPGGEPDLEVWGQDRLWLVAAEIRRRASL